MANSAPNLRLAPSLRLAPNLRLAQPLALGRLTLRNRLVATAHATAAVTDGVPSPADAEYWARLSRGGASMVVTGGVAVAPESTLRLRFLTEAFAEAAIAGMRARAQAIKDGGAVAAIQLCHLGRETLGAGTFHAFVGPSDVRSVREPTAARTLQTDELAGVVEDFRLSAEHSIEAGFDVVELHAAHGYLLAQFLSRTANRREDGYGGSAEHRARLLVEVIEAIRQTSPDVLIGVRVSVEGDASTGLGLDDLGELMSIVEARSPFDYLNVTYGVRGHYVRDMATASPLLLDHAAALRAAVRCPLLLSSSFRSQDTIEQALDSGAADLVGMARAFIADPDLPSKLLAGQPETVRPCVACNEDCRTFEPTGLCTVNPELAPPGATLRPARPRLLHLTAVRPRRRLAVIGAGPAGLESALTRAQHGRADVVLFEREDDIGGQLRIAASAPNRRGWSSLLAFYRARLDALGVKVVTGAPADPSRLDTFDELVWAVGAEESSPDLPGDGVVWSSSGLLLNQDAALSDRECLAILDDGFGWWPTVSCVEAGVAAGVREIVVVTPATGFAAGIPAESRTQLVERLAGVSMRIVPLTTVVSTSPGTLMLRHVLAGTLDEVEADVLAVVGERRSRPVPVRADQTVWADQTVRADQTVWAVGDCVVPRRVSHAVAEGRHVGLDRRS